MPDLYPGQRVKLYQKHLQSTQDGVIVRVDRTVVDISAGAQGVLRQYRKADQRLNDPSFAHTEYFRTIEQHVEAERRAQAVERLGTFGCRFDLGSRSLPVEKLERIVEILEEAC